MEQLLHLDHQVFTAINGGLSNSFFDHTLPVLTDLHFYPLFWIFVAVALVIWVWRDRRRAVTAILGLALCFALSETVGYRLVKNYVPRPRPEFTPGLTVKLRTHSHSGDSFPSLHTTNCFSAATFLSFVYPVLAPVFFIMAAIVGFSRIYVGVHFPSDVLAGAVIGIACAFLIRGILRRSKMPQIHFAGKT